MASSFLAFLFVPSAAMAAEFPSLQISDNTLSMKNQFLVNVGNVVSGSYLRPKVSRGSVKIFNPVLGKWVSGNALWSLMPQVHKNMKVQIDGIDRHQVEFFVEILNPETFTVTKTDSASVWGFGFYLSYWQKINELLHDKMAQ